MAGVSPGLEETRIAIAKALDISLADLYRDSTRQRDGQSPTRKVADMTAAELETLIVMAFGHNVEVKTELERLRRENTELKIRSKISHLPFGILPKEERWREDVALYFLTGDPVHLDREVPKAIADRLRRGIQFHGMEPKALSPRK